MDNQETLLKIAARAEFEVKQESQAIEDYQKDINDLILLREQTNDKEDLDLIQYIIDTYNEIIADEQNHQLKDMEVYSKITGVKPKAD